MSFLLSLLLVSFQVPDEDPIAEMRRNNNYGVDSSKLERGKHEHYFLNGNPVSKDTAIRKVSGIPDDSKLLRVTVIGAEEDRKLVVNDFKNNPIFKEFHDLVVLQDYPPEHWSVKDAGFFTEGKPVIYIQQPNGKVLHRQNDYVDGPEGLVTALRKADPNYRREGDPDLRGSGENPLVLLSLLGIAIAVVVLFKKESRDA